jgi:tetratricopeptide (TPR) repeat protein
MSTARISLRIVVFKLAHGVWRRRREAASARLSAAPYFAYHSLYSEAVVSSIASAVALAEVGQFREAVQHVQRAAKALYEAAKEAFEQVKVTVQHLVKLFVEAVARALAWVDEHKAYLFLMAAVAAGVITLSVALNLWGLVELEKLAHFAMGTPPFIPAGVERYSREEVFSILREAPDPYEKFREIAKAANAGEVKLAEPWESLRLLIMPKPSEERRLMRGRGAELYSKYREDENYRRALLYAVLALEEAFGVYRSALKEVAEERVKAVEKREVGEGPFKRVVYMLDLHLLTQLAEKEDKAFEKALEILRKRLNEYAVKYGLGDLLNVNEGVARELAEAEYRKLSELNDVNFGVKALAALIAYREYALGRRGVYGIAAGYWLEEGGSAWLLYYTPITAYDETEKTKAERPATVEEMVAEALRRLFLKPGADHYSRLIEELTKVGKLAPILEKETKSSYVFRLYNMRERDKLEELNIKLWISRVGEGEKAGITYALELDAERGREFFAQKLEVGVKVAEEVRGRLPVEDPLPYMLSWVTSDVAITRNKKGARVLEMGTSHLWQLAETYALFNWSYITVFRVSLTLEGPKPQFYAYTSLQKLDEAIRRSAQVGWLKRLGVEAGSWDGLKRWVSDHWDEVINMVKRRLEGVKAGSGFDLAGALVELEGLKSRLDNDKIAREVIAPALLLIQAERLGVNEATLKYFGAAASGAISGDGHVSAAMKRVELASGERAVALLWGAVLAAYGIKAKVWKARKAFSMTVSGEDAVKQARLYFLYGPPLLEEDEKVINYKLSEAVELGAEGLNIRWEGLRKTPRGHVAADLTISEASVAVKYNVYLRETDILLRFRSTDRGRAELATRLLKLAGVGAEVKKKEVGNRDVWRIEAHTDKLAAGRKELRDALAEIVRTARGKGWVDAGKADGWLEKLEKGRVLREGWPKYHVGLAEGALVVRYKTTNPDNIEREKLRLKEMGLKEGKHFSVKMPEEGRYGYVSILREGLAYVTWLSVHGEGERQRLAAEFVEYILQRAKEEGEDVYRKTEEIVKEGKARGSLKLEGFEKKVAVNGSEHVVKVIGGEAEIEESQSGKKLLRIKITAEVNGVRSEYTITYGRYGKLNAAMGRATVRAGMEADAERFAAVIKALTGEEPKIRRMKDGRIMIECGREHLDGFKRYAELADAIERWLEETSR